MDGDERGLHGGRPGDFEGMKVKSLKRGDCTP